MDKLEALSNFLEKKWYEKAGLVSSIILTTIIELQIIGDVIGNPIISISTVTISAICVVCLWLYTRSPPKTPEGKIGFLVSISSADDEEGKKLREDFILPLRNLIKSGKTGDAFHFMELPPHISKNVIESDDAESIRVKTKAHYMLFGRVRLRELNGKDHHVIDINGVVAHNPLPDRIRSSFASEFSELLPKQIRINKENDFLSFQFTSEWADLVARYIIGVASAYSRDLDYAETLFNDVLNRLVGKDINFPAYEKLSNIIPKRLSEINEARAILAHENWLKNHNPEYINQLGDYLGSVEDDRHDQAFYLNLKAIYAFLANRDVNEALNNLKKINDDPEGTRNYNLAFLYAYNGDLRTAIRHYRHAILRDVTADVLTQLEDFMCWILEEEPDKYQFHYCLGFFNWKAKGDYIQGQKDLEKFLELGSKKEFVKERELAKEWIKEISQSVKR